MRTNSSSSYRKQLKTPQYHTAIEQRRIRFKKNNNVRFSQHKFNQADLIDQEDRIKTSSKLFETSTTFKGLGFSHRIRSSHNIPYKMREKTQSSDLQCMNKKQISKIPLTLFKQINSQQKQSAQKMRSFSYGENTKKYLRKGTAVNKGIMINILKKKYNRLVSDIPQSYSTHQANSKISTNIKRQIPRGLRDVIGSQQMLRMSKIFTGTQLNSVNLHFSVNKFISKYTTEKHQKYEDDEDLTLKSIKRW